MKVNTQQNRTRPPKEPPSSLAKARALHKRLQRGAARRAKVTPGGGSSVTQAPLSPQEVLAKLRERSAPPMQVEQPASKSLNELLADGRRRNDEAYCDELRAQGKQIYMPDDVVKLGYTLNPAWTQKDLQARMLCGPVLLPLETLKKQADKYFQTFVIPGRKAVLEIMSQAYDLFCLAMEPTRVVEVFAQVRSEVEKRMKKKPAEGVSNGALFVRYVFAEFDDRKVHLYSKALEYAYATNVSVDDFKTWVPRRPPKVPHLWPLKLLHPAGVN